MCLYACACVPLYTGKRPRQLLREIAQDEDSGVRFLLPGAGNQARDAPTLIVVLDLSHGDKVSRCQLCVGGTLTWGRHAHRNPPIQSTGGE